MHLREAALVAALVLIPVLPGVAASQELGVMAGRGSSDFLELGGPASLSAQVAVPLDGRGIFRVVGAYRVRVDTGERSGTVCDFYGPEFTTGCLEEPIVHDTRLHQWEAGMTAGLPLTGSVEVRASALRVRNSLRGSSEGAVSGRSTGSFYPNDTVWSTAWVGALSWRPNSTLPVAFLAQLRNETLTFLGCAEHVRVPFCAESPLTTLEVGILLTR